MEGKGDGKRLKEQDVTGGREESDAVRERGKGENFCRKVGYQLIFDK